MESLFGLEKKTIHYRYTSVAFCRPATSVLYLGAVNSQDKKMNPFIDAWLGGMIQGKG